MQVSLIALTLLHSQASKQTRIMHRGSMGVSYQVPGNTSPVWALQMTGTLVRLGSSALQ